MQYHGLKIYYAISGIFGVIAVAFYRLGMLAAGSSFLYMAIYFFGCGVSEEVENRNGR